ncbi:hypothetical protein [Halobacillus sp. K22]|uniref:hypothetical protein n=1 Tax=Halobacillus sp. K22 TaxID=3457431 RepID=UPI003FCE3438
MIKREIKQKEITQKIETVNTTEEYVQLREAVERQGGRVVETIALRNGQGISVKVELAGRCAG